MRKNNGTTLLLLQDYLQQRLQRGRDEPLNRQLYRALREAVVTGRLAAGALLPASRVLAAELQLGRNTVLHAYEQLLAEGYCVSRGGAGTYVASVMPEPVPLAGSPVTATAALPGLSQRGQQLLAQLGPPRAAAGPAFIPGRPDVAAFPWASWFRLLQRRQRQAQPADFDYRHQGGHPQLKAELAEYLRLSRGVNCEPGQILITTGMQQAFDLLARVLADTGETVWMEEPGYLGAKVAWQAAGLHSVPVPVDEEGLCWQGGGFAPPRLIYVTPSHQYPLGTVMSLARRQALLQQAARLGAWLVEDDYDGEFRHHGRPLAAMQGLDRQGRVLYLGTFSKVMFPALRLAYIVAPPALIEPLQRLQARLQREPDYTLQAALADFIADGQFAAHLRRMRGLYAGRQRKLRDTLARELGGPPQLHGGDAGMHVTLQLKAGCDDAAISTMLAEHGISAPALSGYCLGPAPFPGLVLGYAGLDDAALVLAAVQLARLLAGQVLLAPALQQTG